SNRTVAFRTPSVVRCGPVRCRPASAAQRPDPNRIAGGEPAVDIEARGGAQGDGAVVLRDEDQGYRAARVEEASEDLETDGGRAAVEDDAGEAPDRDAEGGSALRDVEGFGQPGARAAGIRGEAANEGPVAAVIADRRAGRRGAVRARRRADRDRRGRPVQRECSGPDRPTR